MRLPPASSCSASPPRGPRSAGSSREAQRRQVGLDLRAQVLGVAGDGRCGSSRPSASWPVRRPCRRRGPGGPARLRPRRRGARTRRRARRRGRRSSSPERSSAAVCSRRSTSASRGSGQSCGAILAHVAQHRAEDAVDEARRVGAAERLGGLDGLVDRALGRDRRGRPRRGRGAASPAARCAGSRFSSGAMRSSVQPLRVALDAARRAPSAWSAVACASARVKVAASRSKTSSSGRPVRSCW